MPRRDRDRADLARRISGLAGAGVRGLREVGAQHGVRHVRVTLAGGREAFAKVSGTDLGPAFEAEARGLRWLAGAGGAGGAPLPEVLGSAEPALLLASVPPPPAPPPP